jgi:hypothetical protein
MTGREAFDKGIDKTLANPRQKPDFECPACHDIHWWWRDTRWGGGSWICATCHPPPELTHGV